MPNPLHRRGGVTLLAALALIAPLSACSVRLEGAKELPPLSASQAAREDAVNCYRALAQYYPSAPLSGPEAEKLAGAANAQVEALGGVWTRHSGPEPVPELASSAQAVNWAWRCAQQQLVDARSIESVDTAIALARAGYETAFSLAPVAAALKVRPQPAKPEPSVALVFDQQSQARPDPQYRALSEAEVNRLRREQLAERLQDIYARFDRARVVLELAAAADPAKQDLQAAETIAALQAEMLAFGVRSSESGLYRLDQKASADLPAKAAAAKSGVAKDLPTLATVPALAEAAYAAYPLFIK